MEEKFLEEMIHQVYVMSVEIVHRVVIMALRVVKVANRSLKEVFVVMCGIRVDLITKRALLT